MSISQQEIQAQLSQASFGTLVTRDQESLFSRSMLFAYDGVRDFFFVTHRSRDKLGQIHRDGQGLLHVGVLAPNVVSSCDVRATGRIEEIDPPGAEFARGVELLGQKNAMIRDLMASSAGEDYALLRLRADEIVGWSYQQAVDQLPKTRLAVASP